MRHGQSAVEFVLLITALLFIIIPVFYLLADYSFNSGEDVAQQQLLSLGKRIVDESREIYFLGKFSKEIIVVNMPKNIDSMSTLIIEGSTDEYYLIFNYTKRGDLIDLAIPSEVPIITGDTCTQVSACYGGTCHKCQFDPGTYKQGIKNLKIETIPSWRGMTVVNISQVSW